MSGPYSLDLGIISNVVPESSPGAYILSEDGKIAHYVGRSDNDLAERLNRQANNYPKYTHFWFETTTSAKTAFDLECRWWHKFQPEDNEKHPDRPDGSDWQCPVCDIFEGERRWY